MYQRKIVFSLTMFHRPIVFSLTTYHLTMVFSLTTRGRNSGSPVARGYQILLWATRKKALCSPLVYQTLWLYGRENQQSAVRISSNRLLPSSASLPNWYTLQIAALDACAECLKSIDIVIAD